MKKLNNKGFTLIELIIAIGILAILLAIVLIAINPARQFKQANDTKRRSDVVALLDAIHQYAADNKGAIPGGITGIATNIATAGADICDDITTEYISALPKDPSLTGGDVIDCTIAYDTHYQVMVDTDGRVTVSAPDTSDLLPADIAVTR